MSRVLLAALPCALTTLLILSGCEKAPAAHPHAHHEAGDHDHDHDEHEEASATFSEGLGLLLAPETAAALGLKTGIAEPRSLVPTHELTATVFDAGPPARASAFVPADLADELEQHPPSGGEFLSVHRSFPATFAQAELVLTLPGTPTVGTTVTRAIQGRARQVLAVPQTALLRTATGTFLYIVNGAHLLRTPVLTGITDGEYLEIRDGLPAGRTIVTAAVEQLWLTELRLTKGGGHSH